MGCLKQKERCKMLKGKMYDALEIFNLFHFN